MRLAVGDLRNPTVGLLHGEYIPSIHKIRRLVMCGDVVSATDIQSRSREDDACSPLCLDEPAFDLGETHKDGDLVRS